MNIEEKQIGSVCVLVPRGDVWYSGGWSLHEKVKDLADADCVKVVVDMAHIERINSMGLGMLVACVKTLRDKEGDLRIAHAQAKVTEMLKLVNLYDILSLHDSTEDAVAAFGDN
jgi:anti-sigma B factor antagonist